MSKIDLDKYYTDIATAKYCISKAYDIIGKDNISEIIEPSAGNGSFSLQIPNCVAYDIKPEHTSITQQDFLELKTDYKKGRLFIGNPPFGTRNTLSVKFFKQAVTLGDFIAFILPVSQYNNNQQMYDFDLIHSEVLPLIEYSGVKLLCCFNIYKRPPNGLVNNKAVDYKLKDVEVVEYRRGGTYDKPNNYDFGMCSWGHSLGKEVEFVGKYAQENYIIIHNKLYQDEILDICKTTDWKSLYPFISSPKIQTWKIYKYLKEKIPTLN